jgi:hypothetical protein
MWPESFRKIEEFATPTLSFAAFRDDGNKLVIRFSGDYPDGSKGAGYAKQMLQICKDLVDDGGAVALVVDLSDLSYRWGDEVEWIYRIRQDVPQATVVSEKNRRALSTLEFGPATKRDIAELEDCFDSIEAALTYVSNLRKT